MHGKDLGNALNIIIAFSVRLFSRKREINQIAAKSDFVKNNFAETLTENGTVSNLYS